ncbi:MAG: hypothetical protein RMM53_08975 [Bacteroidia bacterium]|nr:hypothetical protein [Bacteroidia bacterium]MDW8334333.1 hypothetical protein [Bacteroidia bacterium]
MNPRGWPLVLMLVATAVALCAATYFILREGRDPELLKKYLENHAEALLGEQPVFAFPPADVNRDGLAELLAYIPANSRALLKYGSIGDTFVIRRGVLLQTRPRKTTQLLRFERDGIRNSKGEPIYRPQNDDYKVVLTKDGWLIDGQALIRWDASAGVYR